jgi:glycosyltransferase involved in cell wall biosynthesis
MSEPTIGVVIPSYNQKRYLVECIESVIAQSFPPSQIVICDDASSDGSQEVITEYAAKYPKLITALLHPQNLGLGRNFNSGLRRIAQEYVSMIAADDVWSPDKLKHEVEALKAHGQARWAYSAATEIDQNGEYIQKHEYDTQWRSGNVLVPMLCLDLPVRNCLIEADLMKEIGYYDETFTVAEDWDLRIRLAVASPAVYVNQATVHYRKHAASVSNWSPELYLDSHLKLDLKHRSVTASLHSGQRSLVTKYRRKRIRWYYRATVVEALNHGHRMLAFKYFLEMVVKTRTSRDLKLMARILLPVRYADRISRLRTRDKTQVSTDRLPEDRFSIDVDYRDLVAHDIMSKRKTLISGVICSHRRPDTLTAAIQSLVDQTLANDLYEIIVVDNNSKDETREIVQRLANEHRRNGLQIRYSLERKLGLSHARNRSIAMSNADVVAFVDDDAVASPQWLESVLAGYEKSPDVWAVGGPVDPIWDGVQPKWLTPSMYGMLSLLDMGEEARTIVWPERIIGVNCSFRRQAFDEVGIFATSLGRKGNGLLGFEDTEIQQRIHGLKKQVLYVPEALVFHRVPGERMTRRYFARRAYFTGKSRAIRMNMQQGKKATIVEAGKIELSLLLSAIKLVVPFRVYKKRRGRAGAAANLQPNGTGRTLLRSPIDLSFRVRETRVYFERMQKLLTDIGFLVQAGILAVSSLKPGSKS